MSPRAWVMAARRSHGTTESEPVLFESDGETVTITRDDGDELVLDRVELTTFLTGLEPEARAA